MSVRARQRFLEAFAASGSIRRGCVAAGVDVRTIHRLRQSDAAFAASYEEAEETACDALEQEARRRALDGVKRPLASAGRLVRDDAGEIVYVTWYSDALLMALLKAHRPEKYRDRVATEHSLAGPSIAPVLNIVIEEAPTPVLPERG